MLAFRDNLAFFILLDTLLQATNIPNFITIERYISTGLLIWTMTAP
jgi:hypothetical protein